MKHNYECHNDECLCEFEVNYTPSTPNWNMSGRMEDAIQGNGAEVEPYECPECGEEVDIEYCIEYFDR